MPYTVTIQNELSHLRIDVSGERKFGKKGEDAISVWSQVAEVCREMDINRILAIFRLSGRASSTMGAFQIVESAKGFGWSEKYRLAIVDTNEESRKDNLFIETVAVNYGYTMKVFDNEQEAKEWLLA